MRQLNTDGLDTNHQRAAPFLQNGKFKPSPEHEQYWQELPPPPAYEESLRNISKARIIYLNNYFDQFSDKLSLRDKMLNFIANNYDNPIIVKKLAQLNFRYNQAIELLERHKAYANFMPMILYNDVAGGYRGGALAAFIEPCCEGLFKANLAGGHMPQPEYFSLLQNLASVTYYFDDQAKKTDIFYLCFHLLLKNMAKNKITNAAAPQFTSLLKEIEERCSNDAEILEQCSLTQELLNKPGLLEEFCTAMRKKL